MAEAVRDVKWNFPDSTNVRADRRDITLKRLFVAVAMVVAILSVAIPARAVTLSSGVVVVRNLTPYKIRISLPNHFMTFVNIVTQDYTESRDEALILPGATWSSSACCYLAGTVYRLFYLSEHNPKEQLFRDVKPHVCHRNGLLYGFAVVAIAPGHSYELNTCYEGST